MPTALLSVSDKSGIVELGLGLQSAGWRILSTGGTARALEEGGVTVTKVSEHTGAPEIFGGRVKTLHPRIHGGVLGRRELDASDAAANDIDWIDMVVVNLYPFEKTVKQGATLPEAVEQIDIGGPTLLRAAAKNHAWVTVVCDPSDYEAVLARLEGEDSDVSWRGSLAVKAFRHTAAYDAVISTWLGERIGGDELMEASLPLRKAQSLRYGENPHQGATFFVDPTAEGRALGRATQLQGKALSFNNLNDLDGALRAVFEFEAPACVVVKHTNPCGAAVHEEGPSAAFKLALSADPVSAYGGIVAFNRPLEAEDVRNVFRSKTFFEILAAPGFDEEAREIMSRREKLRVMELPSDWASSQASGQDAKRIQGGWLFQDWDQGAEPDWNVATEREATSDEDEAMRFAWAVCRNVKSNAIVLARAEEGGFVLNGVGAGQMSRVDAVGLAVEKATRPVEGSVMASDAFFPFADGLEVAGEAGVCAVVQPGGSIRDTEVIEAANARKMAMVLTGTRHFRH
ncbi:MAG: bifunctional phosphoribosylaminoimidazolecarboxamide formyltransferase/IMP cyclohydrolase [Myxococcota bacterium]|nr:bifunctional phosphoribosylaminoimidazolecarboxamide formyltransferase/IMP cyclohydrolase [Myxococcota bacterium]